MKNIVIVGCGFAGMSAAVHLAGRRGFAVTVIDKSPVFNFLPLLPDLIGRGLTFESLVYPIDRLSRAFRFDFVQSEVTSIDLASRRVLAGGRSYPYDRLILASGTETNFYGNVSLSQSALKLDDAQDGLRIRKSAAENSNENYIVAGGGYTGIEIATNLAFYLQKNRRKAKVTIVERQPEILGSLPRWIRDYVLVNLKKMGVEVIVGSLVEDFSGGRVKLSGERIFERSALVWAAGVRTPEYLQQFAVPKSAQGRINTDAFLQFSPGCFAAGDSAYFIYRGQPLRMAVQFAVTQGAAAAFNAVASAKGRKMVAYIPRDLGYVIPMANNRSCGTVFGLRLKGFVPTAMHYAMCLYRLIGAGSRFGILKKLLTG